MAAIVRENTIAQVIIAANAIATLLSVIPKFLQKVRDGVVSLYFNFKEIVNLALMALGVIVFLFFAFHYIENEYHVKARLSRILDPSTAVKEF